jgi:hypothetical protein
LGKALAFADKFKKPEEPAFDMAAIEKMHFRDEAVYLVKRDMFPRQA